MVVVVAGGLGEGLLSAFVVVVLFGAVVVVVGGTVEDVVVDSARTSASMDSISLWSTPNQALRTTATVEVVEVPSITVITCRGGPSAIEDEGFCPPNTRTSPAVSAMAEARARRLS